jgi:hypothetical protein
MSNCNFNSVDTTSLQYYNDHFNYIYMLYFALILHHYDVAPFVSIIHVLL